MNGVYVVEVVLALLFLLCCYLAYERDRAIREADRERDEFYASRRLQRRIASYGDQPTLDETLHDILDEAA